MSKHSNKIIGTVMIIIGLICITGLIVYVVQNNGVWNVKGIILGALSIVIGLLIFFENKSQVSIADIDERNQQILSKTDSIIVKILFILSGVSAIISIIILQFNNNSIILIWFLLSLLLFFIIAISKVSIYLYNYFHL